MVEAKQRKCAGKDCDKDADQLQCPTCQKLGKDNFFCSQDCFKRNWVHSKPYLSGGTRGSLTESRRANIRPYTSLRVTLSAISSLQKSCLNLIQQPVTSILSQTSRILAHSALFIPSRLADKCPRRYHIQTTQKMEFLDRNKYSLADIRLPFSTRHSRRVCAKSVG